jgi:hypothetical protein
MGPWQKFEVNKAMHEGLARKLEGKEEIFSFRSDPLLASLISCLGLQYELGKRDQDRSSFLLGIDLDKLAGKNPWQSEIIALGDQIGLRAWVPGIKELAPLHEDFRLILHPFSMQDGRLSQLVIFPLRVADAYLARGIELVVVRDWALSAFIGQNRNLNYQKTNKQEIEENIALLQLKLMRGRQLAFTGTHDLGDHLLGGHASGIAASDALVADLTQAFSRVFADGKGKRSQLVTAYLAAVMLDDLVQPQWYGSAGHTLVARRAMALIELLSNRADIPEIFLPQSFHEIVDHLRSRKSSLSELEGYFLRFSIDLQDSIGTTDTTANSWVASPA